MRLKFKVGDKVRVISVSGMGVPLSYLGQTGTVDMVYEDNGTNYSYMRPAFQYKVTFPDDFYFFCEHNLAAAVIYITVDEEAGDVLAEHTELEAAERDARASVEEIGGDLRHGIGVYQRIVAFRLDTKIVETRA
jgi:hypothetical protein